MEDLVQAAILHTPVANQLRVGGPQVDLLIGQFEEGGVLVGTDAVGPELVEGLVFLPGASGETRTRLGGGGGDLFMRSRHVQRRRRPPGRRKPLKSNLTEPNNKTVQTGQKLV